MITCDTEIKTSNSFICFNTMFHMLHDLVVILYLSHYYHVAMLQDMRNSCCIHMLHYYHSQAIQYETNRICECFICMFQGPWHDEIDDAHVYETKCN